MRTSVMPCWCRTVDGRLGVPYESSGGFLQCPLRFDGVGGAMVSDDLDLPASWGRDLLVLLRPFFLDRVHCSPDGAAVAAAYVLGGGGGAVGFPAAATGGVLGG